MQLNSQGSQIGAKVLFITATIIAQTLLAQTPLAFGPSDGSGGGGADAQEFVQMAQRGRSMLFKDPAFINDPTLIEKYDAALTAVQKNISFTSEPIFIDGIKRDAKNFPDIPSIEVNLQAWRSLNSFSDRKTLLATHEICGVARIVCKDYNITGSLVPVYSYGHVQINAEPGTELDLYDQDRERLQRLNETSEEAREAAVAILKKYFGFSKVEFKSMIWGKDFETITAVFMAIHLREILPAWVDMQAYVRVDRSWVSGSRQSHVRLKEYPNARQVFIIEFDSSEAGMNFYSDVKDVPATESNRLGRQEIYRLVVGGKRFLFTTDKFKSMISLMANFDHSFSFTNFDILP